VLEGRVPEERITLARLAGVVRQNRSFRRLYSANAVSQLGDWFNVVALYSLLLELTGTGKAISLVLLTRLLPLFIVGPAAGVVADRLSRRSILIACDLLRFGLVAALLLVRTPSQIWLAYLIMTAHAVVSAFFEPAQSALFPSLVPAKDLVLAGTLENSLWSLTLAVGSAAGGVALALFGRDLAFALDAVSFLASAALIRGLPDSRERQDLQALEVTFEQRDPQAWSNLLGLHDLREGVRYVVGHRRVRAILLVKAGFGLTLGGVITLLPFFGERVFQRGNGAGIAMLWTARGVGSFLGPFAAFRLVGHQGRALRRGIAWAFALIIACYLAFALSPGIALAALSLAFANAGGSILWTYGSALLQQIVPDQIRGRVAAAEMGGMTLCMSSSTLLIGYLLDRGTAPRLLMACCGLVALLPILFWLSVQEAFRPAESLVTDRPHER